MEKKKLNLEGVVIKTVTSPSTIKRIAEDHAINPQEVFVRVTFEYEGNEYASSNKLRFFGEEGYNKLLAAKASQEKVNITVTINEKGSLMYLDSDEQVEVKSLFTEPVKTVDNRKSIEDLF